MFKRSKKLWNQIQRSFRHSQTKQSDQFFTFEAEHAEQTENTTISYLENRT